VPYLTIESPVKTTFTWTKIKFGNNTIAWAYFGA